MGVLEEIKPGSQILLEHTEYADDDRVCSDLLKGVSAGTTNVLRISALSSDPNFLAQTADGTVSPDQAVIIDVGGNSQRETRDSDSTSHIRTITVSDPADLPTIEVRVTEALDELDVDGVHLGACFNSITTLSQYADSDLFLRFLHVLTGKFRTAHVTAHFHLNPRAHEESVVAKYRPLFDVYVKISDEGEVTVAK